MLDYSQHLTSNTAYADYSARRKFVAFFMAICMVVLVLRAVNLQVFNKQFLQEQGDKKQIDEVTVSAYRGMIKDRNGEPLAISAPVQSVWVNSKLHHLAEIEFAEELTKKNLTQTQIDLELKNYQEEDRKKIGEMEKILEVPKGKVARMFSDDLNRQFAYVVRRIVPEKAEQVKTLAIAGVNFQREFKRYYPAGEVSSHLLGFTTQKDEGQQVIEYGQEGIEKAYEADLKGKQGIKRVIRDGKRRIIDDVENIKEPESGKTLVLSIDQRIQYLAYRELKEAVRANKAQAGALVVLDAKSGEVLAAVNQPSFNPNLKINLTEKQYRNRAFTEVFEPGSTVKPFVVAAAIDGGFVRLGESFQANGTMKVGSRTVTDVHKYGRLDLTGVLKKSSNIAVSQMALRMPREHLWNLYRQLGFGVSANVGFPGEAVGSMLDHRKLQDFDRAILSFGYGLNGSALQLARAYTALADDGVLHSVSLFKRDEDLEARRIFSAGTVQRVRKMMESVVTKDGTAYEARVDGYRVAGKTGTVKKASGSHGYGGNKYFAVFAGMAPASDPRLIITVMIDEPGAGQYYGGLVSAPVFSKVMSGALRLLGVAPDQEDTMPILLTLNDS